MVGTRSTVGDIAEVACSSEGTYRVVGTTTGAEVRLRALHAVSDVTFETGSSVGIEDESCLALGALDGRAGDAADIEIGALGVREGEHQAEECDEEQRGAVDLHISYLYQEEVDSTLYIPSLS